MNRDLGSMIMRTSAALAAASLLLGATAYGQDAPPASDNRAAVQFAAPVVEVSAKGTAGVKANEFRAEFQVSLESRSGTAPLEEQLKALVADLCQRLERHGAAAAAREGELEPGSLGASGSVRRLSDGSLVEQAYPTVFLQRISIERLEPVLTEAFRTRGFVPCTLSISAIEGPHNDALKTPAASAAVVNARRDADLLARGAGRSLGELVYLRPVSFRIESHGWWRDAKARDRLGVLPLEWEEKIGGRRRDRVSDPSAPEVDWGNPDAWPAVAPDLLAREVAADIVTAKNHIEGVIEITAAFELLPAKD
jgi:hypothetical protein